MDITSVVFAGVNAVAMTFAALYAILTFSRQKREIRVQRVSTAISELTTGPVAEARNQVKSFTDEYKDTYPPPSMGGSPTRLPYRTAVLIGKQADATTRMDVFVMMWALQRLSPLADDLKKSLEQQQKIVRHHITFMVETLEDLRTLLALEERSVFADSARAADAALRGIAGSLRLGDSYGLPW